MFIDNLSVPCCVLCHCLERYHRYNNVPEPCLTTGHAHIIRDSYSPLTKITFTLNLFVIITYISYS